VVIEHWGGLVQPKIPYIGSEDFNKKANVHRLRPLPEWDSYNILPVECGAEEWKAGTRRREDLHLIFWVKTNHLGRDEMLKKKTKSPVRGGTTARGERSGGTSTNHRDD